MTEEEKSDSDAGYTRYQATVRIENFYAYRGDEEDIRKRLKRDVEQELGCVVLEVSDVIILAQE